MVRRHKKLLGWDPESTLDGGAVVYSKLCGLTYSYGKDPAGHIFHLKALKQAGFFGKRNIHRFIQTSNIAACARCRL